ncbi:hypothetical protein [Streptomyces galbus]|uniref:hypothetical protein n=1 Tax=Streptomyces galbus TaxID=33898 RepID=UPI003EBF045F
MVRTAHVLSVAALTGAVLVAGPTARADPAVEVGPASVDAGGTVTVSVTCDPLGAPAPQTLDATSDAFADGTAHLRKVSGDGDELSGPAYRGTARVSAPAEEDLDDAGDVGDPGDESDPDDTDDTGDTGVGDAAEEPGATGADAAWTVDGTCPAPPGGRPSPWSAPLHVTAPGAGDASPCAHPAAGAGHPCGGVTPTAGPVPPPHPVPTPAATEPTPWSPGRARSGGSGRGPGGAARGPGAAEEEPGDTAPDLAESLGPVPPAEPPVPVEPPERVAPPEPVEPVRPGRQTEPVTPVGPEAPATGWDSSCGDAPVQHGVRGGQGGAFTDSVPALAAGGLLIAGALGAAVHRVRRRGGTGRM